MESLIIEVLNKTEIKLSKIRNGLGLNNDLELINHFYKNDGGTIEVDLSNEKRDRYVYIDISINCEKVILTFNEN